MFFDIIGIAYLLIIVLAMVRIISYVLRGSKFEVDINHSDNSSGLSAVGGLLSVFLPFFTALSLNSVAGTLDHKGQELQQIISDWLSLALFSLFYFFLFIWPMLPVKHLINNFLINELNSYVKKRRQVEQKIRRFLGTGVDIGSEQATQFSSLIKFCQEMRAIEKRLINTSTWPIRRKTAYVLAILGLSPIILALLLLFIPL